MNPAPIKPLISTSDLDKIDVRVGTILAVEDVAHSEKLIRLRVDFGDHARSILVGMKKERPSSKEIEGRQALFVVNLAPRKVAGEISEGLLFDIGYLSLPSRKGGAASSRDKLRFLGPSVCDQRTILPLQTCSQVVLVLRQQPQN